MSTLSPTQAATIASGVYGLRELSISQSMARGTIIGSEGIFNVEGGTRFTGRSGGLIVCKELSGFGYIAQGADREHQDEVLVVTRGTDTPFDWVSNANVGLQTGPGGELVHAGFHEVWKSFAAEISTFMRGRHPRLIHCVGHSLGGALATLNADYFSSSRAAEVKLYTFGCPRTGGQYFSRSLCQRVGEQNIYRVQHRSDPVPKIPLFPFFHVPLATGGYQLAGGSFGLINTAAHSMLKSYIPGVKDTSWADLARSSAASSHDMEPQPWMGLVAAGGGGIVMSSAWALSMIGKALSWVLRQASLAFFTALSIGFTVGFTVLDQLAWMLSKGAELSVEISLYVRAIITAIFKFLGRTVVAGASLTLSFIRWVLGLLFHALATVANQATSLLD